MKRLVTRIFPYFVKCSITKNPNEMGFFLLSMLILGGGADARITMWSYAKTPSSTVTFIF